MGQKVDPGQVRLALWKIDKASAGMTSFDPLSMAVSAAMSNVDLDIAVYVRIRRAATHRAVSSAIMAIVPGTVMLYALSTGPWRGDSPGASWSHVGLHGPHWLAFLILSSIVIVVCAYFFTDALIQRRRMSWKIREHLVREVMET